MDPSELRQQLKELMVAELNLEGKSPVDIDDSAPLFGEGLGLDSLDALQLAMSVEERFGVRIPEGDEARPIFASVNALVDHIVKSCSDGGPESPPNGLGLDGGAREPPQTPPGASTDSSTPAWTPEGGR